jgi:hypothetical protein
MLRNVNYSRWVCNTFDINLQQYASSPYSVIAHLLRGILFLSAKVNTEYISDLSTNRIFGLTLFFSYYS